jgi:hypothetical protein
LLARAKTVEVNVNPEIRLPWEKLLWGKDPISPDLPVTTNVSRTLLASNTNARSACLDFFPDSIASTFTEMRSIVNKHEHTLLKLSKDFTQEISFLRHHAEPIATTKFIDGVLAKMPTLTTEIGEAEKLVDTVRDYIKKEKLTELFLALGDTFKKDFEVFVEVLDQLHDGVGPKKLPGFPFSKELGTRLDNFYMVGAWKTEGGALQATRLVGGAAAEADFKAFEQANAQNSDISTYVSRLRKFSYLLPADRQDRVEQVVRSSLKRRRVELLKPAIADGAAGSRPLEGALVHYDPLHRACGFGPRGVELKLVGRS